MTVHKLPCKMLEKCFIRCDNIQMLKVKLTHVSYIGKKSKIESLALIEKIKVYFSFLRSRYQHKLRVHLQ